LLLRSPPVLPPPFTFLLLPHSHLFHNLTSSSDLHSLFYFASRVNILYKLRSTFLLLFINLLR
jgi:hypothetical protein